MQTRRLTLTAGLATEFVFDSFGSNSIVIKNETAGEVLFCDGEFIEAAAAHIPAFAWQAFNVRMHPDRTPSFYIKAAVSGTVEVNFGSSGMGALVGPALDAAGLIPHTLTLTVGADTTLTASLIRLHGETLDLDTPVSLTSGATVFTGDVISYAAAASVEGFHPVLTINGGVVELTEGSVTITVAGETMAAVEAAADEEA